MVGKGRFRPIVAITAAISLLIAILSVYCLFSSYSRYRARDLRTATNFADMATLPSTDDGSCVGTPTKEIFESGKYQKSGWSCGQSGQKKLANLLSASVHGLFYASQQPGADPVLVATAERVATAVLGGTDPPGVNASNAHAAFTALDAVAVPTSCRTIYGAAAAYDGTMVSTLPQPPKIDCAGETAGTLLPANVDQLYTHCLLQHSFGRSGPAGGTQGLPVVGAPAPGPLWYPWPNVSSFNETASWHTKSRMFLGMRFSWSLSAYTVAALSTGFILVDSACVLLAELTWPARAEGTKDETGDTPAPSRRRISRYTRSIIRIISTHVAKRARRFILLFILVAVTISFFSATIWSTWGLGRRLGRPICEAPGDEASLSFDWASFPVFVGGRRARGGWQPDWNATIMELVVVASNVLILLAIPISESLPTWGAREASIPASNKLIGRDQSSPVDGRSNWTSLLQIVIWIGVILIAIGNALVSNAFNGAWARAVAGEAGLTFDETEVNTYNFDQGNAFMTAMLTGGFVSAAVQGRWLINGLGCNTALVFFAWCAFAICAIAPLVIVFSVGYFTSGSKAVQECEIFENESGFNKDVCDYKRGLMIAGLACFVVTILFQTFSGIFQYFPSLFSTQKAARVDPNMISTEDAPLPSMRFSNNAFFDFSTARKDETSIQLLHCPPASSPTHEGMLPLVTPRKQLSFRM